MSTPANFVTFEPEFIDGLKEIFEVKIVFNAVLGLKVTVLEPDFVSCRLNMCSDLTGFQPQKRLSGGVISAALDTVGGLMALTGLSARHMSEAPGKRLARFSKLGTISLHVDFLQPALGKKFDINCKLLQLDSRVAKAQMEFRGSEGSKLSTGVGTYIIS